MNYDKVGQDSEEEPIQPDQDGLRARSEQAIGELAQALIESPTVHNAIAAAFGAREKAIEAQHAAMSALNGQQFNGRALTVNEARPREERGPRSGGGGNNRQYASKRW